MDVFMNALTFVIIICYVLSSFMLGSFIFVEILKKKKISSADLVCIVYGIIGVVLYFIFYSLVIVYRKLDKKIIFNFGENK